MEDELIATILGFIYPFLVILFWILVLVAIVWGIVKLIKRIKGNRK